MKRRLEAEPRLARRLEYPAGGAKRRTNAASTNGPGLMDRPRRFHLLWKTFAHRSRYIIVALCPSLFLPLRSEDPSPPPSVAVGRVSPELIAPRTPAAINLIKSENVPRPTMKLNGFRVIGSAGNERKRVGPMPSLEILLSRFGRIVASAFQIFLSSLFPLFSIWILSFS